jgi:uncharacterized membrane protein required for colicin V production
VLPGRPQDWLDWVVVGYLALGAWWGWRRGLVASVVGLAADVVGLGAAVLYSGPLLKAANTAWGLNSRLTAAMSHWFGMQVPAAPGRSGQPLTAALAATEPVIKAQATGLAASLSHALLGYAAFLAILLVVRAIAAGLGGALTPRSRILRPLDGGLGLAFGAVEHALVAALAFGFATSVGGGLGLHGVSAAIQSSPWARALEDGLYRAAPQVAQWLPTAARGV